MRTSTPYLSLDLPVPASHLSVLTFRVAWILYTPLSPSDFGPGWQSGRPRAVSNKRSHNLLKVGGGYLHMQVQPLALQRTLDFLWEKDTGQEVAIKNLILAVRLFS